MISSLTIIEPATETAMVSLVDAKAALGIADDSQDGAVALLIDQATAAIASYCRRPGFGIETVEETIRSIHRASCIVLERDLAPSISEISEDGADLDAADWLLDGAILLRLRDDMPSPWTAGKLVITYNAGYALPDGCPADLQRCCLDLIRLYSTSDSRDPLIKSMTLVDDSMTFGLPTDLISPVLSAADPYVRVAV